MSSSVASTPRVVKTSDAARRIRWPATSAREPCPELVGLGLVHGYDTAFWWSAAIFAGGAAIAGLLLRRGPLTRHDGPQEPGTGPASVLGAHAARG
jgi:hypothetical protein